MNFYVYEQDFGRSTPTESAKPPTLEAMTSVTAYKRWFFDCLKKFGRIVTVPESTDKERLKRLLVKPDAIFVSVNAWMVGKAWEGVPHRLLALSLGNSLFPEGLYCIRTLPTAQVNLVSTRRERDLTIAALGDLAPRINILAPRIATDFFVIPDKGQRQRARNEEGITEDQVHIIYAGRWVATKGICQLIRCLDLWPIPRVVLTLVGNIEEHNKLAFSFANHATFRLFLEDEIMHCASRPWLRLRPAKNQKEMRACFWSADLFVNPSVQPDENYGITPAWAADSGSQEKCNRADACQKATRPVVQ